jgi:hypothetical protein
VVEARVELGCRPEVRVVVEARVELGCRHEARVVFELACRH